MTKKQKQTNEIFKNDNYKALPSALYTASHMQYVDKQGNTIEVPISSDFKLLYGFLFDQCRSFKAQDGADGEGQDLYQDWDIIFRVIGRKYTGDKTSLKLVKLLEDAGILVQTKRLNTTSTIKHVFDVSIIPTIKFSNPDRDLWVKEQGQRRADRQRQYAEQKKNKLAAIEEAKKQHSQKVQNTDTKGVNEQPVKPVEQPEHKEPEQTVKPVEQTKHIEPEHKQPEIKINTQTNWFKYREKLIEQNDKWHELNVGQQQRLMSEIVECKNSNYIVIQDVFNRFISACFYTPAKNDTIQTPKQQPSSSIVVPPAIQAMNDAFDDEGFPFGDDCPF
ncbi:hypothetical protein QPK06_19555 [Aeromonas veronii]|uniref:hypothetical protein n=1 Tax=Aeromonas veronii TaxID=654 RepID=UPI001119CD57|nr:hypothetical protein [Aeromonas veronii]MCX0424850.1 hypothetical protein [Aeromonas veronii]TNI73627.1 hypothetical protein CF109_10540 [Aeromonas veronii]WIJ41215.1 hypothetical protein QPK06_19555 [Aeromonas veronii]